MEHEQSEADVIYWETDAEVWEFFWFEELQEEV